MGVTPTDRSHVYLIGLISLDIFRLSQRHLSAMLATTVAFLLDDSQYVPDLVWSGCFIAPPVAIWVSWVLARRQHRLAAAVAALTGSVVAAHRVPFALAHLSLYVGMREWLIVGFSAVFPLYCGARYVIGMPLESSARTGTGS